MGEHSLKAILVVMGLFVVAAVGSGRFLGSSRYLAIRLAARTGIMFLLLGAFIGPGGLNLIDPEVLDGMGPIVILGLGWIGFLYGTNLEYRALRRFDPRLFATALGESLTTMMLVLLAMGLAVKFHFHAQLDWQALWILAAAAAGTAPASLFMLRTYLPIRGPTYDLLRFCASIDDLPGIIGLGIVFSISRPLIFPSVALSTLLWLTFQILLGVLAGILIEALFQVILTDPDEPDAFAFSLPFFGMVGLFSGFSSYIGLSPLFVSVVAGITFANISQHSERVYTGLARREHTLYVLFLLMSGCYWPFRGFSAWDLLAVYILVRLLGKLLGTFVSVKSLLSGPEFSHRMPWNSGLGLMPQGGLAIAMVVSYLWRFGEQSAGWAVNIVHMAVILNELVAPYVFFNLLRKVDEA